jgi:TatA/E family protein of Tat protein translocase
MERLWYLIPFAVILVLVIWGPSRLPEIGAGMGRAIREFRSAVSGVRDAVNVDVMGHQPPPGGTPAAGPGPGWSQPVPPPPPPSPGSPQMAGERPPTGVPGDGHRG